MMMDPNAIENNIFHTSYWMRVESIIDHSPDRMDAKL